MKDGELKRKITALVNEEKLEKLEKAEALLIDYVHKNPDDLEGWNRLIILETLDPIEDYEQATEYTKEALTHHNDQPIYFVLILLFARLHRGELDHVLVEQAKGALNKADPEIASMISLLLANYYRSRDSIQYEAFLTKSIEDGPYFVGNYLELGDYYLEKGQRDLGKELIRKGLAQVQLIYKTEDDDEELDWLDIDRYVNEMLTRVFIMENSYNYFEELLQQE
ncbi:hypothetical protein [Planococcus wigleyi]|uniref:Tetratricopeptide repeat protein n=1 Tax=Planococcus wigleyi TaxID=2762216 RepID=A0ABR8WDD0_9BACL|nr:hypothetical protein [Planococcus wigleyi]MBD8015029.1 hypothetical protein [Planococcus wigleyi]